MKPRITVSLNASGEFEILINEAGRDLLVRELKRLDEKHEHFHLSPEGVGEVEVSSQAYYPDDKVLEYGKVIFRTDEWDRKYFPHVFSPNE